MHGYAFLISRPLTVYMCIFDEKSIVAKTNRVSSLLKRRPIRLFRLYNILNNRIRFKNTLEFQDILSKRTLIYAKIIATSVESPFLATNTPKKNRYTRNHRQINIKTICPRNILIFYAFNIYSFSFQFIIFVSSALDRAEYLVYVKSINYIL